MKRSRFTEDQIIGVLKEHEAGMKTADLCRKHGISEATFYNWKAKFGGMEVSEAKRLKTLEDENARLKKLPDDIEAFKAMVLASHSERASDKALIAHLKLQIAKFNRERFGQSSERSKRLLDQLELQLEELEASATEDELAAEQALAKTTTVASFTRKRPARKPFPEHLPRERVVVPGPTSCPCCGGIRLCKLGEDVTETLEVIPRRWKVIQHVREKFSCRDCESISQAPAPFHVISRGWEGRSLLAMVLLDSCRPRLHLG